MDAAADAVWTTRCTGGLARHARRDLGGAGLCPWKVRAVHLHAPDQAVDLGGARGRLPLDGARRGDAEVDGCAGEGSGDQAPGTIRSR